MAKTIKFNLICDGKPIRTIEDLQSNFSIEDILSYYDNKLLHRWLSVRGYDSELEKVSAITSGDPMVIIKELIHVFDVVSDMEKVEESIYMLKHLNERKELCAIYEQENYKAKNIIDDYETGYRQLVSGIFENPNNAAVIKANIAEIVSNYAWILELNHRELFYALKRMGSYLAVMCLLMNETARKYYLPLETINKNGVNTLDIAENNDKKDMFDSICSMIKEPYFADALGENIVSFSGMTDGYWKDLEPKGKSFMIISMGNGDYVRSAGHSGGDLSSTDILNKFVIVDGVDYKSNSNTRKLLYMEV